MAITIDIVRELAEEIAPKISYVMGLPIQLDNLEFIFEDDTRKGASYNYIFEENKGQINLSIKNERRKHVLSYIIAHELCHHIQFSNFPHLEKERGIIKGYSQILPYRLLVEGDAQFSAHKAGYMTFYSKINDKLAGFSLAFAGKYDYSYETIDIYCKGSIIIESIYQKCGRKEINRLYFQ